MPPDWQLNWQVSAGRLAEILLPAAYVVAVIISACVLADTRRRRFAPFASAAWTLLSLLFPHIVLPLYLLTRLYTRRADAAASNANDETARPDIETSREGDEWPQAVDEASEVVDEASETADETESVAAAASPVSAARRTLRRLALPVAYAATLFACGALYFFFDYGSIDTRLSRAEQAKIEGRTERAISEYRAVLNRRDDPHVRKLLGLELSRAKRWDEALAELRASERGGEPDDALPFYLAAALNATGRASEAAVAYQRFLQAPVCTQTLPDPRCDAARAFLQRLPE